MPSSYINRYYNIDDLKRNEIFDRLNGRPPQRQLGFKIRFIEEDRWTGTKMYKISGTSVYLRPNPEENPIWIRSTSEPQIDKTKKRLEELFKANLLPRNPTKRDLELQKP